MKREAEKIIITLAHVAPALKLKVKHSSQWIPPESKPVFFLLVSLGILDCTVFLLSTFAQDLQCKSELWACME